MARARVAEGAGAVEPFRLFHNMLSSQPICFNLFGPLVRDTALAARLLPTLVPEQDAEVTRIVLEWAHEPAADYLCCASASSCSSRPRAMGESPTLAIGPYSSVKPTSYM